MANRGHQLLHADALAAELEALGLDSSIFGPVGVPAPVFANLIPRRAGVWDTDPNTFGFSDFSSAFTRASEALYRDGAGKWQTAADNVIRPNHDANGNFLGMLFEPESVNECENYNANPDAGLTGVGKAGLGTLTREDMSTELAAAKLDAVCTSGFAFKIDATAGTTDISVSGTSSTNENTVSAFIYCQTGTGHIAIAGAASQSFSANTGFECITKTVTPVTGNTLQIRANNGAVVYFVLNQLEEQALATSPIVTLGASATRAADACSWRSHGSPRGGEVMPNYFDESTYDTVDSSVVFAADSFTIDFTGVYSALVQKVNVLTVGDWYQYSFRLSNLTRGNVDFYIGGAPVTVQANANQVYTGFHQVVTDGRVQFADSDFAGTISELSIKRMTPWLNNAEGMLAVRWRPGFSIAVGATNDTQRILNSGTALVFYRKTASNGEFCFRSGALTDTCVGLAAALTADTDYLIAARWAGSAAQIGVKVGGTWTWGTAGSFDASGIDDDGTLQVSDWANILGPAEMQDWRLWNRDEGTAFLEKLFTGIAN